MRRPDNRPGFYLQLRSQSIIPELLHAPWCATVRTTFDSTTESAAPGVDQLRAGGAALVRWAVDNPALAQLLHWRPVPGFAPTPETFALSQQDTADLRSIFAEGVRLGQLRSEADSEEALRLWTVVLSGLMSQQMASEPGVSYREGQFSRLTETAIEMFLSTYQA